MSSRAVTTMKIVLVLTLVSQVNFSQSPKEDILTTDYYQTQRRILVDRIRAEESATAFTLHRIRQHLKLVQYNEKLENDPQRSADSTAGYTALFVSQSGDH